MAKLPEIQLELVKCQIDYIKQITTLSTGSILLLTAFLEKLFSRPAWKLAVVVAFVGFLSSVVGAILAHTMLVESKQFFVSENVPPTSTGRLFLTSLVVMWGGFLIGMTALGIFAVRNFW